MWTTEIHPMSNYLSQSMPWILIPILSQFPILLDCSNLLPSAPPPLSSAGHYIHNLCHNEAAQDGTSRPSLLDTFTNKRPIHFLFLHAKAIPISNPQTKHLYYGSIVCVLLHSVQSQDSVHCPVTVNENREMRLGRDLFLYQVTCWRHGDFLFLLQVLSSYWNFIWVFSVQFIAHCWLI